MSDKTTTARSIAEAMYAMDTASQALGIDVEVSEAGSAVARTLVTASMLNGHGVCHGGHIFALADTAFAFACNGYGIVTVAAGASIEFLRPAREGDELAAVARERSRGGRTGIYDVTVTNQDGVDVALFRGRSHTTGRSHADSTRKK
jgi:acyl-CoA thioesterase